MESQIQVTNTKTLYNTIMVKIIRDIKLALQVLRSKIPKQLSQKPIIILLLLLSLLIGINTLFQEANKQNGTQRINLQHVPKPTSKEDEPFGTYSPPTIPKKEVYTIFLVGDSMTEVLGPHGGKLNEIINTLYQSTPGHQRIVIDNYAKGSTNLLGLADTLTQKITVGDRVLDPLLSRPYDILLIESFGYNPLSQLGIEEGLKKQTGTLDQLMKLLTDSHPNSIIIFVATIAPNKANYAEQSSPGNTLAEREAQAIERMEYIKNHIAYAKTHNIPLINIYSKSLAPGDDGDLAYINPNDHIHPSFAGIDLISHEIANFIYENQILPR